MGEAPPDRVLTAQALPALSKRVTRWRDGVATSAVEQIADEVPVALAYNGVAHAVMMATPADVEDFAIGFTLSEAIVAGREEILDVRVRRVSDGVEVAIEIPSERQFLLASRQRNLAGRTGCGLCGTRLLSEAVRPPYPVRTALALAPRSVHAAADALAARQPLNALTGAMHAAAWVSPDGTIREVREDIGRHNALDKLIGRLSATGVSPSSGFVLLTSRASFEMVQKAATVGIEVVAAMSAPTALAIAHAERANVTLVAFVRAGRHTVYTHPQRLHPALEATRT
jgi:FdhD protein